MRRVVLLAGGVLLAGAGLVLDSGAGPSASPAASISGAPLTGPVTSPGQVEARTDRAATRGAGAGNASADEPALDLDHLERVGDHYEAPLRNGGRAVLTLDPALQETAEKLLEQAKAPRAAIVAMAPDGRILALAGRRTEEPKGGKDGKSDWRLATEVWSPAASVFKLVTASALVSEGVNPDDTIRFHGGIRSVTESNLRDDRHDNRSESLLYGVAHSNNAIVGKFAYQHLQPGELETFAHHLGLGTPLPPTFPVPAQTAELALPQEHDLSFARAAAGFNGSRISVLAGALLAATFADDGEQPVPRLVASVRDQAVPVPAPHRVLPEKVARAVGRMMAATCEIGSAKKSFRRASVKVAGKTGTLTTTDPFYMQSSWFVGYAPADKPEIVVSVLLGNPETWYLRGHEAARKMIDRAMQRAGDRGAGGGGRAAKHVR